VTIFALAVFGEGEFAAGYAFTPYVGYFACPGIETQAQGIAVLHLIQSNMTSPRSQARWPPMTGIEENP
jgi:hypothetical protein